MITPRLLCVYCDRTLRSHCTFSYAFLKDTSSSQQFRKLRCTTQKHIDLYFTNYSSWWLVLEQPRHEKVGFFASSESTDCLGS